MDIRHQIGKFTYQDLVKCVRIRAILVVSEDQLALIYSFVRYERMNTSILEAEYKVWSLHRHYITVLKNAGFYDLPDHKSHISIAHILKCTRTMGVRNRMKDVLKCRNDYQFERKYFGLFMQELGRQDKQLKQEHVFSAYGDHKSAEESEGNLDSFANNNTPNKRRNGTREENALLVRGAGATNEH